jgi:rhomboid protease GluP
MFKRQTSGSVVCPSCGNLVGVNDQRCYNCGRWNPGLWGFAPLIRRLGNDLGFVPFVMGGCVVLYALTLLASGSGLRMSGPLSFLAPSGRVLFLFGASGALPVFELGRWWTVISAGWLHANLLHILFNMLWVRQLAPATADVYGGSRMIIIYTIAGICGFALSSVMGAYFGWLPIPFLHGAGFTVGASAPIFGLLGALVHYGRRGGSSLIGSQAVSWAITLFIFGLIMPGVDNYAHAGGFAGGYLASRWLDPLRPERLEHFLGAFACLLITFAAIVWSVVTGWALLGGG